MFQGKDVDETKHTFYVQYPFPSENRAVYEIVGKNVIEPRRPEMKYIIIRHMRFAC